MRVKKKIDEFIVFLKKCFELIIVKIIIIAWSDTNIFQYYWKLTLTFPWPLSLGRFLKLICCGVGRQFFMGLFSF